MNNDRRAEVRRAMALIAEAAEILQNCSVDELGYIDNMPDSIRDGDKGTRATEVVDALDQAVSTLEDLDLSDVVS